MKTLTTESQLLESLRVLKSEVARLKQIEQNRPRVSVRSPRQNVPFLGQSVPLTVQVTDGIGNPLSNQFVLLTTSWGKLQSRNKLINQTGTSLSLRTDPSGQIQISLQPATSEDLLANQTEVLSLLLGLLNATASTPQQDRSALNEMVQIYRWNTNYAYQQAVDIYFKNFGQGLLEAVNVRDYLADWQYVEATICAHVQPDAGSDETLDTAQSSEILSSGALRLPIKNWLGAFLEVLLSAATNDSNLPHQINVATKKGEQGAIVDGVFQEVETYLTGQRGFVDDYVRRKVAKDSLNAFLETEVETLSLEDRLVVTPALIMAGGAIATGGTPALVTLTQSRKNLQQAISPKGSTSSPMDLGDLPNQIDQLTVDISGIRGSLGKLSTDTATLNTQVDRFDGLITGLRSDQNTSAQRIQDFGSQLDLSNSRIQDFTNQLGSTTVQIQEFETRLTASSAKVDGFDSRLNSTDERFNRQVQTVNSRLDTADEQLQTFDSRFSQTAEQLEIVDNRLSQTDTQNQALTARLDATDSRLNANNQQLQSVNTRLNTTDSRIQAVSTRLTSADEQLKGLETTLNTNEERTNAFDSQLARTNSQVSGLQQNFATVNTRVGTLNRQVTTLNNNIIQIDNQVKAVDSQVQTIETNVGEFNNRFGTIDRQISGLNVNLTRVTRAASGRIVRLEDSVSRVGNNVLSLRTDIDRPDINGSTTENNRS